MVRSDKIKNALPEHYALLIVDGPPSVVGRDGLLSFQEIFTWDCHILLTIHTVRRTIHRRRNICAQIKSNCFQSILNKLIQIENLSFSLHIGDIMSKMNAKTQFATHE